MDEELERHIAPREEALARIRSMLVNKLKVALPPGQIDIDAPLVGTGIGLDSIDAVELVVALEAEFGIFLEQGAAGPWAFRTVHALVDLVVEAGES